MMKASYSDIKYDARQSMKGHMGEVILVGLILPIAFSMIARFFNGILEFVHFSIPLILSTYTTAVSSYITYRMLIKISRFKSDKIFTNFLGTKKGILSALGWGLFVSLIFSVYLYIYWDYVLFFFDLIAFISSEAYLNNPDTLGSYIENYVIGAPTTKTLIISTVYSIFVIIITIRFSFALYIIGDTDENIFEALKKSWLITSGNWWRLFFFPLSFLLWIFAVIFTFGLAIIYVTPYMAVAQASMYNRLLKESEFEFDDGVINKVVDSTDENALDDDENKFDKKDPFGDYYE